MPHELREAGLHGLQILTLWFSPAFPVGSYSYSHGLEWAIEAGWVHDRQTLEDWVSDLLEFGAGRSDAILMAQAFRAEDPSAVAELAEALTPSSERHLETMAQGTAFARTASAVWDLDLSALPYPVTVGRAARLLDLPLSMLLTLFLQSFAANVISAGVRLIPLGQSQGQATTAAILPLASRIAASAENAGLEEIGGVAIRADIASMLHETQYTRLYRS